MTSPILNEIAGVLARAEAAAYERGKSDGRQELLDELIARAGDAKKPARPARKKRAAQRKPRRSAASGGQAAKVRPASERKRAPKGVVRSLVHRALSSSPGLKPAEILNHATDDFERMVQLPSVRNELRRGNLAGLYVNTDGAWSLSGAA
ncbi:MAG: hypothetical protein OXI81_11430 [Paracoccaceae bacterium]|nr:hypothetical protein [Paracoccaceae bacterium]